MKTLKWISLFCAVLLLLSIPTMGNASDSEATTTVSIEFEDGGLSWGDMDAMTISFGTQDIPDDEVTYESISGPHSIILIDQREVLSIYEVYVSMTSFTSEGATPFEGSIAFTNGTCSVSSPEVASIHLVVLNAIASQSAERIAYYRLEVYRAIFTLTWADSSQVTLTLSKEEALKIVDTTYTATLTWELRNAP